MTVRVVMYVQNDATHDSRVLREAASLADAGHAVTVVATTRTPDEPDGSREERDGFTIVRVAQPAAHRERLDVIRAPWRSIGPAVRSIRTAAARGPAGAGTAVRGIASLVLLAPWLLVRGAWVAIVNRGLGRPVRMGWLEYVRRWRQETLGWCRAAVEHAPVADVHHAHDMEALPAARAGARRDGGRYVYDSHEIFTGLDRSISLPRPLRLVLARWERSLARGAAAIVTVNDDVADALRVRFGVRHIVVVHNCAPRWTPPAVPDDRLRGLVDIAIDAPVVLYHGVFQPNRGLEQLVAALREPGLVSAHLVLLGYPRSYVDRLDIDPATTGRVHHVPAVDPAEVTAWVAGADVDAMPILPVSESLRLSTPNKLFESIAAGVPVVAADLPAMRRIVLDPSGPLGALCDPSDPASIASAIRLVLELEPAEQARLRSRILDAAHARWNWETEAAGLVTAYADLASSA